MTETPWFKCYPSDFLNGVAELSPHEGFVYTIVIMRIYDEGGPIPDDPEKIARRCNMRLHKCKEAIDFLCAGDDAKLIRQDGYLSNTRAQTEITNSSLKRHQNARSANKRWEKQDEKPNKNNDTVIPLHAFGNAKPIPTRDQKLYREESSGFESATWRVKRGITEGAALRPTPFQLQKMVDEKLVTEEQAEKFGWKPPVSSGNG
jgi:uncharacterized protein YdaU (DUF1376 family)